MDKLRVAILGYGRTGSTMHAGAIETIEDFQVAAVCDVVPEKLKQAQERFGCKVYKNHRRMLAAEKLDLVSVLTRSGQHCRMACDCLRAGVNVLVTKPWCVNERQARRMVATAEESGKLLLPWLPARWSDDLARLREVVASGRIGKVYCVRRAVCGFGKRNDWQTQRKCGGGYILNWGPHVVDTAVQLTGRKVRSVYAWTRQVIDPGDVEDSFFAVLTLDDGVVVHTERTVAIEGPPSWYIQGDRGTIVVRGREMTVRSAEPPAPDDPTQYSGMQTREPEVTTETVGPSAWGDEHRIYREVAQALRGGKQYPVKPLDALELTRVLDAIRKSAQNNKVVTLD